MAGKEASSFYITGPDDSVLVGDSEEVVTASGAQESDTEKAQLDNFMKIQSQPMSTVSKEAAAEMQQAAADSGSVIKSQAQQAGATTGNTAEPSFLESTYTSTMEMVNKIDEKDQKAAIEITKELVKTGNIDVLAGNTEALDNIFKATGLEDRCKDLVTNFDLDDYTPDIKLDMIKGMDWSDALSLDSMSGMFDGMSDLFPDFDFGEWTDSSALSSLKDSVLFESLFADADWIDTSFLDSLDWETYTGKGSEWLSDALDELKSDKHTEFVMKLVEKLSPEILKAIAPKLINNILRVYPMGFGSSYAEGWDTAYRELTLSLAKIDPEWYLVERNGKKVFKMEPYYAASDRALAVLSTDSLHQVNCILVKSYKVESYDHLVKDGLIVKK